MNYPLEIIHLHRIHPNHKNPLGCAQPDCCALASWRLIWSRPNPPRKAPLNYNHNYCSRHAIAWCAQHIAPLPSPAVED